MLANLTPQKSRKTSLRRTSPEYRLNLALDRCTKPAAAASPLFPTKDENIDGGRAFFSGCRRGIALTRRYASCRKTGHQKRSQFRFEVPARIAFPGGRCRNGRCDCSPASRERFEGTLMSGPQYLAASFQCALLLNFTAHRSSTHFTG